ncbi:MAG TPA: rhodanese-like domain-containing protein, partial [Cyclobacteriaceae bacterium]
IHLEWTNNLEKENVFKSSEALKEQFEKLGITPDKQIITYCRSGVRAAHTGFILKDLLGYENVKIFDGSWIEWSHFGEEVEK